MIRSVLKAALPRQFVQLLRDLGRLESGARVTYLRLACRRRLGRERPLAIPSVRNATILVICHGNVLRSAYAEAVLKQQAAIGHVSGLRVSSAGLHAVPGRSADPRAVTVGRENGLDLTPHRTTLLDAQRVATSDLLVVMDYLNEAEVLSRHPEAAGKVVLLGRFDTKWTADPVIPDPHTSDLAGVRASCSRVAAAAAGVVYRLNV
jgi:protein-tyrosine phosphatase